MSSQRSERTGTSASANTNTERDLDVFFSSGNWRFSSELAVTVWPPAWNVLTFHNLVWVGFSWEHRLARELWQRFYSSKQRTPLSTQPLFVCSPLILSGEVGEGRVVQGLVTSWRFPNPFPTQPESVSSSTSFPLGTRLWAVVSKHPHMGYGFDTSETNCLKIV